MVLMLITGPYQNVIIAGLPSTSPEETVQVLLHSLDDIRNTWLITPLIGAGSPPGSPLLLHHSNSYSEDLIHKGWSPLHQAINDGRCEVASFLLTKGADVNITDSKSLTPLHLACLSGKLDCFMMLLEAGASVTCRLVIQFLMNFDVDVITPPLWREKHRDYLMCGD